jgi:Secretion system C-terminal sorting domain
MEKLKLLFCALAFSSIGLAQQPKFTGGQKAYFSFKTTYGNSFTKQDHDLRIKHGKMGTFQPTVLWSEDFSNGIPAGWENTGTINKQSGDTALWEYRGPNTNPDTSIGSRGNYGLNKRIISPTRSNGWVIFDSDYLDNEGIPGNDSFGPVPAPHFGSLITDVIDLSGEPFVKLEMIQYFRYFASTTNIFISIDSGKTWLPDTIHLNTNIERNNASPPDDFVSIDISKWVGGQSGVKIRFEFNSFTLSNGISGYYFWQLDDIRIIRQPDNDLVLQDIAVQQGDNTVFYGFTPMFQAVPTTWKAKYSNDGKVNQPNTKFEVKIEKDSSIEYQKSSIPADLKPDSSRIDSIFKQSDKWMPSDYGTYDITFEVSSDSTNNDNEYMPGNNFMNRTVFITETVYSVDSDNKSNSIGTSQFGGDDFRLANIIEIHNPYTWIISVYIELNSKQTIPGGTLRATVRDTVGGSYDTDFPNIVCESDFHIVSANDTQNGYINLGIPRILNGTYQNRKLQEGKAYYISVELFSNAGTNNIKIWDDESIEQPWWASIIYVPGDRWYANGNAFLIRAGLDPHGGIDDNPNIDIQLIPNPATGYTHLDLVAESATDFHVVISNISGQILKQEYFGNTSVINTNLDVSDMPNGIYIIQINSGLGVLTRKLIINR